MAAPSAERRTIGGYHITGSIGSGGMGTVYVGEHQLLGRKAAIKVLLPELSQEEEQVQRFFNEAKAAAAIKHPGIVKIYDFGYEQDGSAYIAMELLAGEPMSQRTARVGMLPVSQALRLVGQAASVLAAAHEHGIVHRDLKPENLLIAPDPQVTGGERVKILDFGIAKFMTGEPGSGHAPAEEVMGSPAYMAPEQIRGAGTVDHRADLYSLGCILFELLCGRPPFATQAGTMAVLAGHLMEEPPVPSTLRADLSAGVDALVLRLLAKEPRERYESAQDLEHAVAAVLNEPITHNAPSLYDSHEATLVGGSTSLFVPTASIAPEEPYFEEPAAGETWQEEHRLRAGTRPEAGQVPRPEHGQKGFSGSADPGDMEERSTEAFPVPLEAAGAEVAAQGPGKQAQGAVFGRERGRVRGRLYILAATLALGLGIIAAAVLVRGGQAVGPPRSSVVVIDSDRESMTDPALLRPLLTFRELATPADAPLPSGMTSTAVASPAAEATQAYDWLALLRLWLGGKLLRRTSLRRFLAPLLLDARVIWRIGSDPPGATLVAASGEVMGRTPTMSELDFTLGYVERFTLKRPGYEDATLVLTGFFDYEAIVPLTPLLPPVTIQSRPPGADVMDQSQTLIGKTPVDVPRPEGQASAHYTVALAGYEPLALVLTTESKSETMVELVELTAEVTAEIRSVPAGATVLQDGKPVGKTPYVARFPRRDDDVIYTVSLGGYESQTVRVSGREDSEKSLKLRPQCAKEEPSADGPSLVNPYRRC